MQEMDKHLLTVAFPFCTDGSSTGFLAPCLQTDSGLIAWLDLDFGIETCFYNGMNTFSKTWLQFVFPVYIMVLVGLVVFASITQRGLQTCLATTLSVSWQHSFISHMQKIFVHWLLQSISLNLNTQRTKNVCGCMTQMSSIL